MSIINTILGLAIPQAAVPLRLLSWARGSAAWLLAHPMTAIALLAAVFGAVEHHEAAKWAVIARQRATAIAAIQSANASAIQQATAAKEVKDVYNSKLAVAADRTAADLRDRYHAAVMQLASAQDRARSADLPGHADAATRSDRPGESASIPAGANSSAIGAAQPLAVSRDDALTCADNTARLQAVHDWAVALGQ
ncbi:MAG: hypothetical protein M3N34_03590 [Pseudomonadota bacterium]|nr:hypothetical protein [Pseudomonadota bacterium]